MKNKKYWLITSALTLLPMFAGLLLWKQLPETIPTHFGLDGAADGWSGKTFAVFGLPLMMLAFHGILFACTRLDKQNRGHNEKVLKLTCLIIPVLSILISAFMYSRAMEVELNMSSLLFPVLGLFFIALGNWLPKIKQNTTLGIKLKWTLYNEENWNKTHRFGGWCWVVGGIVFCLAGFLPTQVQLWLPVVCMVLMILAPTVYSWNLARKQKAAGTYTESQVSRDLKKHRGIQIVSLIAVAVILVGVGFVMFTGDIEYTCTEDALVIEADFHSDLTVSYAEIDSIEFRDTAPSGTREWGFGSARLMMGWFDNDEFGGHTRYCYVGTDVHIILVCDDDVLILNADTEEETRMLYKELLAKLQN